MLTTIKIKELSPTKIFVKKNCSTEIYPRRLMLQLQSSVNKFQNSVIRPIIYEARTLDVSVSNI
jgi:hypothetical protein